MDDLDDKVVVEGHHPEAFSREGIPTKQLPGAGLPREPQREGEATRYFLPVTLSAGEAPELMAVELDDAGAGEAPGDSMSLGEAIYNLSLRQRAIIMGVIVALAAISAFVLAPIFSNPDTYQGITQTLDAKKANVLGLTAAATSASTAISLIPDDVGSAVADKLADLSIGFLIILVAIFLEKYLLTIIGFILFAILIPICGGLYIASLGLRPFRATRSAFARLATRLLLMGAVFFALVPTSVAVSSMIDATYEESINQTIALAEQSSQQVGETVEGQDAGAADQPEGSAEAPQDQAPAPTGGEGPLDQLGAWWGGVQETLGGVVGSVTGAVGDAFTGVTSWFQGILNNFIEAMAVMLVTSCVIPILVLVLFLFIVKAIFNVDVSKPLQMLDPRTYRRGRTLALTPTKEK